MARQRRETNTKEKVQMELFMDQLVKYVDIISNALFNTVLLFLLCGTGIYYTIRLRGVQFKEFGSALKRAFGDLGKKNRAGADGMSSFQALMTAMAGQIGTGNLAGAATAIVAGGPGAIFWVVVSCILGMATIYVEATLAQRYKSVGPDGAVIGGPVYYILAAFKGRLGKILAGCFAVFIILALGLAGNMVQSNSIGDAFKTAFGISPVIVGVVVALIALFAFMGGVTRIAAITEKLVPIMAVTYILGAIIVVAVNFQQVPQAFYWILVGAFAPQAVTGAALGLTVQQAMRFGIARGLFSNEAGMGATPHSHAIAKVNHPCQQGGIAIVGVVTTCVIMVLTALVILTSGVYDPQVGSEITGIALTQSAFQAVFGGLGSKFIAICLFFFAFSTIIGWFFFAQQNVKYLLGMKAVKPFCFIGAAAVVLGAALKVDLVWSLADMFNGLMVIPNLLAMLALSGVVVRLNQEYQASKTVTRLPDPPANQVK